MGKSEQDQSPKESKDADKNGEPTKTPAPQPTGKTFSQRGVEVQK